jgi:2-polyprenyl-3-methyl-5-hydroxy-6-metoxy-1,4-benzoquinol methylase
VTPSTGAHDRDHYSYTVYADPATAQSFDERRFGGPIGELVAVSQANTLLDFAGPLKGTTVLDVGTGTGRAALLLAHAGAHVTGVDASAEMLAVARQRATAAQAVVEFRTADAHALDCPDRSFDLVVCLRVIMHTPDWRQSIAELCRVSAARVVFDYPSASSLAALQAAVRRVLHAVGVSTEAYRVFTDREIDAALQASGFRATTRRRQFVLPIAFHKAIGSRRFTEATEHFLDRIGLLGLFGSPVTLVAERCAS